MRTIRVFEAFAGYGSQMMALKRLERDFPAISFESVGISEIDKNPINAYMAVHGETKNYGDISKIDWKDVPDFDLLTYSFPCTSISMAGLREGFTEGSGTASSLLWECRRTIKEKKPKYLLMENVKPIVNATNMPNFQKWLDFLTEMGYTNHWKILNAKDYGIPQHRERCFCVSILNETKPFEFPKPFELKYCIKDFLDNPLDESSWYNEKYLHNLHWYEKRDYPKGSLMKVGNCFKSDYATGNIYDANGIICTIMENHGTGTLINIDGRIKKATASEQLRFMGVSEDDIQKIQSACKRSACRKLAGNSIVVDVLYYIFKSMFID